MMPITGMASPLIAAVMLVSLVDLMSPFVNEVSRWSRKGEASYHDKAWAEAKDFYDRAALARPGGVREYNRGEAAYQAGKFDEALAAYGRVAGAKDLAPGHVAYDAGNALFRKGDYAGAKDSYRRALRENPDDEDARANYELALHLEKNQQSPKGKNSKSDSQGKRSPSPSDSSQGSSASPPQPQNGDQSGRSNSQTRESPPSAPDSSSQSTERQEEQATPPGQMSPTEAKRLLNAVTPKEREFLEARLKSARRKRAEKDW